MKLQHILALTYLTCTQAITYLKIENEKCPTGIIPSSNLTLSNLSNYLGRWYTTAETPFRDPDTFCVYADYTLIDAEEGRIGVDNSDIMQDKVTGQWFRDHLYGQGLYIGPDGGSFEVSFTTQPDSYPPEKDNIREPWGNYILLGLDADAAEYAYVYSCFNVCQTEETCDSYVVFWVLSRVLGENVFGVSTTDRISEIMDIYRQAGASEAAVQTVTDSWTIFDNTKCINFD